MSTYLPSSIYEERALKRTAEFTALISRIYDRFDVECDIYDWTADQDCEPLFCKADDVYCISGIALAAGYSFEFGERDYSGDHPCKVWIYDPHNHL